MRIMTEAYKDREYFIPLDARRSEGLYGRPLSSSQRRRIAQEALLEAGGDVVMAGHLEMVKTLQAGLTNWIGMYDMAGEEIPFSAEAVKAACEYDVDLMNSFAVRLKNIARYGDEEDEKN